MKLLAIAGVNIVLGTMLFGVIPTTDFLVLIGSIGVLFFSVHVLVMSFKDDLTSENILNIRTRIDSAKLAAVAIYSVMFGVAESKNNAKTTITDITIR